MSESRRITADSAGLLLSGYLGLLLFGVAGLFFGSAFGLCLQSLFKNFMKRHNPPPKAGGDGPHAIGLHTYPGATTARSIGDCCDTKDMMVAAKSLSRDHQYLGAERTDIDFDIACKVRKLISIHHPDKLNRADPSKNSVARATEKVQKIIQAYDRVKRSRRSRHCSRYEATQGTVL